MILQLIWIALECYKQVLAIIYCLSIYHCAEKRSRRDTIEENGEHHDRNLRTIDLLKQDFNYLNKFSGLHLLAMADKYAHLAIKQYLSSKNDLAMNHAVNKSVKLLFFRQNGLIFLPAYTDAKLCYDRIVHSAVFICIQSQNIPIKIVDLCVWNPSVIITCNE